MNSFRFVLRAARPMQLLLALLTYSLGLGIARYLGTTLRPEPQFTGALIVLLLLAASNLFTEYFRPFNEPLLPGSVPGVDVTPAQREQLRSFLLAFGAAFLGVAGMLLFLLQRTGSIQINSALLLV